MNTTHFITSQNKIKISCANPDHELTSQQALAISQNWDYNKLQLYSNTDSVVQEHEKDACETLKKLKKYIKDNNVKNICSNKKNLSFNIILIFSVLNKLKAIKDTVIYGE